jgi:hypothetical protein
MVMVVVMVMAMEMVMVMVMVVVVIGRSKLERRIHLTGGALAGGGRPARVAACCIV